MITQMKTSDKINSVLPDHEIASTRFYNDPRELVSNTWTDPDNLKNW